jgi:anti-sigma factor (TIGR02949 family)
MSDESCIDALLKLQPYLDGELSEADAENVRRHFELCAPCTPALHYLRSFKDALQRASGQLPQAPPELVERLRELIRRDSTSP